MYVHVEVAVALELWVKVEEGLSVLDEQADIGHQTLRWRWGSENISCLVHIRGITYNSHMCI